MPVEAATLPTTDITGVDFLFPGNWNGDSYTAADLDALVSDTNRLIESGTYTPFIKIGHSDDQNLLAADELPSGGKIKRLYRRGIKVYADLAQVPQKLAQLIRAGAYPQRSAEVWYDGIDFEGTRYRKPLKALAFLGATVPAVSSLDDIAARYQRSHVYADENGVPVHVVTLAGKEPTTDDSDTDETDDSPPEQPKNLSESIEAVKVSQDGSHAVTTGTHSHSHDAHGSQGDDATHTHDHTHKDDANHAPSENHGHDEETAAELAKAAFSGAVCPFCKGPAADKASKSDCTCTSDCGAAKCPQSETADMAKPTEKEGAPKSPPKGYPTDKSQYADPTNFKYPIDEGHIKAAVPYFNHPGNQSKGGYSSDEWATMGGRVAAAANKLIGPGHKFEDGKITTDDAKKNARTLAAKPSLDEIRYAVQDELQSRFPYVYQGDGSMPSGTMADGPSADIEDLYDDSVVVWDQDHDELWQLPYSMDATGDVALGEPQKVRTTYEPLPSGEPSTYADAGVNSPPRRANPLPNDPEPQGNRDMTTARTSDQAAKDKQDAADTEPDDGDADYSKILAAINGYKGKPGVGAARMLHGLLMKHLAAMKGQWPDIDKAGNTDGSEGPEGENAGEQAAGSGKDPAHGPPKTMSREQEADMAEQELREKIALLERRENERAEADRARIAELERRDLEREATTTVEKAIAARKLTRAQKDWAVSYYSRDKEGFATFLEAQPEVWTDREFGSAGAPREMSSQEPTRAEHEVAAKLGIDAAAVAAKRQEHGNTILDRARAANKDKADKRYVAARG